MKLSLNWVADYVQLPAELEAEEIAYALTMATVEVEQVIRLAASLAQVIAARVESVEPLAKADRLSVVQCDVGAERNVQVVSAGGNLRPGQLVALALPGAIVRPRGAGQPLTVADREVGGVASRGMICGAAELGLEQLFVPATDRDVLDFAELEVEPGRDLAEAIGFDDVILEIDNKSVTNRPDLLGHRGLARELAAIYDCELEPLAGVELPTQADGLAVEIDDTSGCRRYTATRIEGVAASRSPFWLRSRLARLGHRPINLPVDLTNYVMLALGQPSHAFDRGALAGTLRVRWALAGEELQLLDGESVTLDERSLLIADDEQAIALAGVMGGNGSAISVETGEMVLEIANFEPSGVRRTASSLGLRTDSSSRFEKGLDPELINDALALFLTTLARAQPEARATAYVDNYPLPAAPPTVETTVGFINRRLGAAFSLDEICTLLERFGFAVDADNGRLQVAVPSWRATGDVSLPEDLVEEVGRLHGYEKLELFAPEIRLERTIRQPEISLERRIKQYLASSGAMQEIVSYPWVADSYLEAVGQAPPLALTAPPAPEMRQLHCSLIPSMLAAVVSNLRFYESFQLFEVARVFPTATFKPLHEGGEKLPPQPKHLCAALVGDDAGVLFLAAKGLLDALGRGVQMESLELASGESPSWADPAGHLELRVAGQPIGQLGVVSAKTMRLAGIRRANVALFELDLTPLSPHASRQNLFEPIATHPQKEYDLSLLVPAELRWAKLHRVLAAAHQLVRSVALVEEYRGSQVPAGKKSLFVRVTLGASDRTLDAEDLNEAEAALVARAGEELGAELRS